MNSYMEEKKNQEDKIGVRRIFGDNSLRDER